MLNECSNCGSIETNGVCHKCNTKDGYPINTHEEEVEQLQAENKKLHKQLLGRYQNKDGEYDPILVQLWYLKELQADNKQLRDALINILLHNTSDTVHDIAEEALQNSTTENKGE